MTHSKEITIISMKGGRCGSIFDATLNTSIGNLTIGKIVSDGIQYTFRCQRTEDYMLLNQLLIGYGVELLTTQSVPMQKNNSPIKVGTMSNEIAQSFSEEFAWYKGNYNPNYNNCIFFNAAYKTGEKFGLRIPKWYGIFGTEQLSTIKDTSRNESFIGRGQSVNAAILEIFGGLTWDEACTKFLQKKIA